MTSRRAAAALKAACDQDLDAEALVPILLEALHDVVPSSRNLFDWTDPQGRLLHYFIEGPVDDQIARHYFDVFHNRLEAEAMPAFQSLAQAPAGVRSAADLDNARFFSSALYHEIWRPQDLKYRVEAVLRGRQGQLLGSLVLYRGAGDRCFSRREEQTLQELLPTIADALERSGAPADGARAVPRPRATQSLLLDGAGQVCHASAGARQMLMLAQGGITRERLEIPLNQLARPVLDLLLRALHPQRSGLQPPSVTQDNAWGVFTFAAHPLAPTAGGANPMVQVLIHWSEPHHRALQRALRRLPLTAGQITVCRALYHGHSQAAIGQRLGVAPTTVIDHVRKLYRALEVRSVAELRAVLDALVHRAGDDVQPSGF